MPRAACLPASDPASIRLAAEALKRGGLVVFPTETVYGLGADATNEKALCRIFEVKKRPSFDPLIVHVCSLEQAKTLWSEFPPEAGLLLHRFWPGPFTLVLKKSRVIPDVATAGLPTVALRMPKEPAALALIRALGSPIAAPSANLFGYTSPTEAGHAAEDLGEAVEIILDGGPSAVGLESTVVKIENGKAALLRPGGTTAEEIREILPLAAARASAGHESPGQLETHYSPWTPLALLEKNYRSCEPEIGHFFEQIKERKKSAPRAGLLAYGGASKRASLMESVQVLSEKGDAYEAASRLFRAMRELDKMKLDFILAEPAPAAGIGLAIQDRLGKAAGGKKADEKFFKSI